MKNSISIALMSISISCFSVPFERMNLNQDINTQSLEAVSSNITTTNSILIIGGNSTSIQGIPEQRIQYLDGITFDIYEDGEVNFFFNDVPEGINPLDKILVNGTSLLTIIKSTVNQEMQLGLAEARQEFGTDTTNISREVSSQTVGGMVYNPLWGKKLAAIGDSLISSPTHNTSYPYYIAQRNNMTLVHNGRSGEMLCHDKTNELGQITNMSCIKSYTNDIPADADFILCQIGANDSVQWAADVNNNVDDTDMSLNTFKGCWNNLLIGLKKNYPNSKIGMILPNNWTENLGEKTEDVFGGTGETGRRSMVQWQKIQCQRLNIPVFDPQEDTRMFPFHNVTYKTNGVDITETSIGTSVLSWYDRTKREIGTDYSWYKSMDGGWKFQTQYMRDGQHTSAQGNLYLSFYYEAWMKTALMCK